MMVCANCGKHANRISWSRHQKGSSGASEWPLRAQITKRTQKPNLHTFKGVKFCTKCVRLAKDVYKAAQMAKPVLVKPTEEAAAEIPAQG